MTHLWEKATLLIVDPFRATNKKPQSGWIHRLDLWINNKGNRILGDARTDGLIHLPEALRNTVNAAASEMGQGVVDERRKITPVYTQRGIGCIKDCSSPPLLFISVVLSAALALKSDSSFLWTSALLANTNDSGSGLGAKVLPWLSREKSNQKKQSI